MWHNREENAEEEEEVFFFFQCGIIDRSHSAV